MSPANPNYFFIARLLPLLGLLLVGCQPKVYLMPPPLSIQTDSQIFSLTGENQDNNLLYTLYATNRKPYDKIKSSSGYTRRPSETMSLGYVVHSVGAEEMSWSDLLENSLSPGREKKLLLKQEYVRSLARLNLNDDIKRPSSGAQGLFNQIDKVLTRNFDKDILVYVHGANSNFYRATAQGAQIYHYTGHNTIVLTFSWPSAENLFKYRTDVLHAEKTVPAFAQLLELLAFHTKARNINILAYSAGAQVVAPGLAFLRERHPEASIDELKKRFRIGEVYFAAPDTDLKLFFQRFLVFRNIVNRTTINFNAKDTVLQLAAMQNGVSRLGRPDMSELNEAERQIVIASTKMWELDVLDLNKSKALNLGGAHNSWYNHPWVSNDLLLLLLFNARPEERGLEEHYYENGAKVYRFPHDYDQKINLILNEKKKEFWENPKTRQKVQE